MFYPEKRDGYSRIGKLKFDSEVLQTPTLLEYDGVPQIIDHVDFGRAPYPVKFISADLYEKLSPSNEEIVVLTGLTTLSPRQLVQTFEEVRGVKPIYAVAAAKPSNAALLIYLGADILDNILAVSSAYNGVYFLGDYEIELSKLRDFPCECRFCRSADPEDYEAVAGHNTLVLKQEVEKCRILLTREELRNYVEAKVKVNPEMTATLRISDFEGNKEYFPRFRRSRCNFSTVESANRFEVQYFLKRALECYQPVTDTVLLLPCTAKKPYLLSRTHRRIRSAVRVNVNEIVISSPLVVPREFELLYPAVNYDTPVTGYWSEEEVTFVASWLRRFLEKGEFQKVVAYVEGGYRKVVERACGDFDVTFPSKIEELRREIEGYSGFDLYERMFFHMLRYQFGITYTAKCRYRGRYPEIEMIRGRERVARVDPIYGRLDIYRDIAKLLVKERRYLVEIGDFEVTSTIFAAGIVDADERIRPNDIVVFSGDGAGVGVAVMGGREMVESDRGVAVKVRRKL